MKINVEEWKKKTMNNNQVKEDGKNKWRVSFGMNIVGANSTTTIKYMVLFILFSRLYLITVCMYVPNTIREQVVLY